MQEYQPQDISEASPCLKCKRWKDCIGRPHYEYSDIRFCPYQIMWILENADVLLSGVWPIDTATESVSQKSISHEAKFVKSEIVIGEVEKRMTTTGDVGVCLKDAARKQIIIKELSDPERNVLMYLKGKRRKLVTYSRWKADKNYYTYTVK